MDIVEAIDGDKVFTGSALGLSECSEAHPCPVHDQFVSVRGALGEMLKTTEIMELADRMDLGKTFLKL